MQSYISADTSNILISNENANSFLQTKSRNRRGLRNGLREECCNENCYYEEIVEFREPYGWNAINDALCQVSMVEQRSCNCKGWPIYGCGDQHCEDRLCNCEGTKNSKDWKVRNISYDIADGSVSAHSTTTSSKFVDNLEGEVQVEPSFTISKTVEEAEWFSHTAGSSLSFGATFSAGVPKMAQLKITNTLTVERQHTFGKIKYKIEKRAATFPCPAPAHRYVICEGKFNTVKMSVPYTMTLKHKHYGCFCESKGVYKNKHHTNIYLKSKSYTSKPSEDEV